MVNYRRSLIQGGTYFFTVTLQNRQSNYLTSHIDLVRESFRHVARHDPFEIIAMVVLPEHLHAIWTLPADDFHYPKRWRAIKSRFTRLLVKRGVSLIKNNKGEYNLWQRRYWEHQIRDAQDMQRHVDYIYYNPVKHGHVIYVKDWEYSSFHRDVRKGLVNEKWAGGMDDGLDLGFGE